MNESYGQFCTVARGAEALCEALDTLGRARDCCAAANASMNCTAASPGCPPACWHSGCAIWKKSAWCIAPRLAKSGSYSLTEAGEELRPIIMALGHWGARWIGSRLRDDQLDAGLLMWDVRRFVRLETFPSRPVVIQFKFRDARSGEQAWWLVVEEGVADLCRDDPGRELTLRCGFKRACVDRGMGGRPHSREVLESQSCVDGAAQDAQTCGAGWVRARLPVPGAQRVSSFDETSGYSPLNIPIPSRH